MEILYFLIFGAVAGWIAGLLMKGGGFGLVGNIIVGILGSMLGGWLLPTLGLSFGSGLGPQMATAVLGAVILLFIVGLIKR